MLEHQCFLESLTALDLVESFEVAREYILDGYGQQMYIEDVVNNRSKYIRVKDNLMMVDDDGIPTEPLKTLQYVRQQVKTPIWNLVANLAETAWDGDNYLRIDPLQVSNVDVNKPLQVGGKQYTIASITSSVSGGVLDTIVLEQILELGMDNLPPVDRYLPVGDPINQYYDRAKIVIDSIPAYADGEVYSITIDSTVYTYTSAPGDDANTVYTNLSNQIMADPNNIWFTSSVLPTGLQLTSKSAGVDFQTTISANLVEVIVQENSRAWNIYDIEIVQGSILPTTTAGAIATFNGVQYTILDAGANRESGGDDAGLATEGQYLMALDMFKNTCEVDFLVFMDGGITTTGYAQAITEMCESRMDCVGLLSVSFDASF